MANEMGVERLAGLVVEAYLLMSKVVRAAMRESTGLSVPQFRVMMFLSSRGRSSLSELASHLGVSAPTASRLIGSMSRRGLVAVEEDPGDRRRLLISLTDGGLRLLAEGRREAERRVAEILRGLPGDEASALGRGLEALIQGLAGGGAT